MKGRRGGWTFWRGEINGEGFIFTKRESSGVKKVESLKRELDSTSDDDMKQVIQDDIDFEREMREYDIPTRYGFKPFLIQSSPRGQFMFWEDKELQRKTEIDKMTEETWDKAPKQTEEKWEID